MYSTKKEKIRVFLADLTHTGPCLATEFVPLNIGLIASFAKKKFGDKVEFSLFKYPDRLLDALKIKKPDILGVSNYAWNTNLSEWACRKAKQLHKGVLTVKGGWNFPLDNENRLAFLLLMPATDIYVTHEGEFSFAAILDKFLSSGRKGVLLQELDGCVFVDRCQAKPRLITGRAMPRIEYLDNIPSPYQNGMLDEFLDGKLIPVLETSRGCPFTCNYCNSAIPYYSKVRAFPLDYIIEDLKYISKKVKGLGSRKLLISDANFGMYSQDKKVANKIAEMAKNEGWPQSVILIGSGKNKTDDEIDAFKTFRNLATPTLAFQSLNKQTLGEIKRINLGSRSFKRFANKAEAVGLTMHVELITPLPYETLDTYYKGIKTLINSGLKRITSYTLQMNYGTVYRQNEYQTEHGYVTKYRLIPNDFGKYDGELILETELVGVSTKYLSFEDYLTIRCLTFYTELVYNNDIFMEVIKFLCELGYTPYHYMATISEEFPTAGEPLQNILESFINDTRSELSKSEGDLFRFYSSSANYDRLMNGEIGGNVIFKHKGLVLCEHINDLIVFVMHCARKLLAKKFSGPELETYEIMLDCIHRFCKAKLFDVLDDNTINEPVVFRGSYDVKGWMNDPQRKKLKYFKKEITLVFEYTEAQKKEKKSILENYGRTPVGRTKILAKSPLLQSMFRIPRAISNIET